MRLVTHLVDYSSSRSSPVTRVTVVAVCLCLMAASMTAYAVRTYRAAVASLQDWYAICQVTDMLIYHISVHRGAPPDTWQELESAYRYVNAGYNSFSFHDLRSRVRIDFDALSLGLAAIKSLGHGAESKRVLFVRSAAHSDEIETRANERLWCTLEGLSARQESRNRSQEYRGRMGAVWEGGWGAPGGRGRGAGRGVSRAARRHTLD
jgi:hypothetical protein